jgi:hypothetical protein
MSSRITFSGRHPELADIALYQKDVEASLRLFFSPQSPDYAVMFFENTVDEIRERRDERLEEASLTSSFTLLSAVEAAFRIDYLRRCQLKKRDLVSREFRTLHKEKGPRASFEDEILEVWSQNAYGAKDMVAALRDAFKFRHWVAHGRYWILKAGRQKYDFAYVYQISELALSSFPFAK